MSASSNGQLTKTRIGEVIETSTLGFWAESDQLHVLPEFGSLVKAQCNTETTIFGVVAFCQTGSIDPGRRAVRRGDGASSDEMIYQRHPELGHVLRSTFRVAAVGHRSNGVIHHRLPPHPAPLHYNVSACDAREIETFSEGARYLSALLNHRGDIQPLDLLAAHLHWLDQELQDNHAWLEGATRQLARLMKHDYDQFIVLLDAIAPEEAALR